MAEKTMASNIYFFFIVIGGIWIAAIDAESAFSTDVTTSCGPAVLKQCWCIEKHPCESDEKSETTDGLTAEEWNKILSQEDIPPNSSGVLDLSKRGFKSIDRNAFDNAVNVTSLILDDNNISELPEFIFSKLVNLKNLSLANNLIRTTKKAFANLGNLEFLDISNNPIVETLDDNFFFGLGKSCWILMKGVVGVKKIGGDAFGSETSTIRGDLSHEAGDDEKIGSKSMQRRSLSWRHSESRNVEEIRRFQVCIKDNVVQRLDFLKMDDNLTSECSEIEFKYRTLFLQNMAITKFEKSWFRLKSNPQVPTDLSAINLSQNDIVRVTSDVVNDLPKYITWLDLSDNKIERVDGETFKHNVIFSLDLNNNLISEIEDNAFVMPALYQLYLRENRLKNTKFAATLPSSLVSLHMDFNEITEIPADSFSNLKKLSYLNLDNNRMTTVGSHSLRGATGLHQFLLANNNITTVEQGAFDNLTVFQIHLGGNHLSHFDVGVLTGLERLWQLDISKNEFTKIADKMFDIPSLQILDMSENNITAIEKGSMRKLNKLEKLNISKNPIDKLPNGVLFGLQKIKETAIVVEDTLIEAIQAGLFDDL